MLHPFHIEDKFQPVEVKNKFLLGEDTSWVFGLKDLHEASRNILMEK